MSDSEERLEERLREWRKVAIICLIGALLMGSVAIFVDAWWRSEVNNLNQEIETLKSQVADPQIIYTEKAVTSDDVLNWLRNSIEEFDADSVHIVIDSERVGNIKMTITTTSEIPNVLYDFVIK